MLNGIKEMINQKTDFMEAADLLYEEAAGNLDDLIVLGEETEEDAGGDEGVPGPESIEEEGEGEAAGAEDGEEEETGDDMLNSKIKADPNSALEDEIPEEDPLPLPGDNSIQTGDHMNDEIEDDILSTSIDLRSNTARDTLPIPPGGAGDAIEGNDDMLNQRIDSGFGGGSDSLMNDEIPAGDATPSLPAAEEGSDSMGEEIPEGDEGLGESANNDIFSEAITVAGDDGGDSSSGGDDNLDSEIPEDGGSESGGENDVTSAVRDKVAESDAPDEGMGDDLDVDLGGGSSDKEANIMKKLSKLTKDIEDAKSLVVDVISNK